MTGTYEPLALDEMDRSITLLPARGLGLVLNTLVDLLSLDPSLDLQERAPDGVQADLSIRGATFGQTLVLLNGQRLNDVQTGHHDMDIPVPLDAVARIDVLRGSGSTMYGSDAVGGVINIITEPPESLEVRVRAAVGNDGINQQRASLADLFGALAEQLTFSRDFSTGFMPDRDYRSLQLASSTHLRDGVGRERSHPGLHGPSLRRRPVLRPLPFLGGHQDMVGRVRQPFGKKTEASFAYRRHSDLFVLFRDQPQIYTNHHADQSYQGAVRRTERLSGQREFHYGVEGLHESIVSNNLGIHARSRAAAYASLDFRALRRFSLSLAAREEVYRKFAAEFSPTVAGGVWISPKLKFRASASRAFRVPSYTDLYYSDPYNFGNPNLRPERAWTYEGGLDWNPAPRVRGELTVFNGASAMASITTAPPRTARGTR